MNNLHEQIAKLIEAHTPNPRETLAGDGSDRYFEQAIYPFMGKIAKLRAIELLRGEGYLPVAYSFETDVNAWYNNASEGEREHMANKLAKDGYPTKGKHSEYSIQKAAVTRFLTDIKEDIEDLI